MKSAAAIVGGMAVSVLTATLGGLFLGSLQPGLAWFSLCSGLVGAVWIGCVTHGSLFCAPRTAWDTALLGVFAVACWKSFFFLIHPAGNMLEVQSAYNLGDLVKHLNYIQHIARTPFWPDNPLLAEGGIHYPVGMDLMNSLLVIVGMDLYRSLVWVALVAMIAVWQALQKWGGGFAVAGLLFSGGLAGFAFFKNGEVIDYQSAVEWKNLFLSIVVTQRGFLFALPAGLLLLVSWRERAALRPGCLPASVECLLFACMPLFHLHTFMFLAGLLGFWVLAAPRDLKGMALRRLLVSFPFSAALVWLVTDGFTGGGHIRWAPGWMAEEKMFFFWVVNFGLFIPLLIGLAWDCRNRVQDRLWVWPCAALFLACCFISFAPWKWDNTKLFFWAYLGVLPALWLWMRRWIVPVRAVLCAGLFFSGAISLAGGLRDSGFGLISRVELDGVDKLTRTLPVNTRIATAPDYNHPVYLLGHRLAMGYDGYLYGHGLDYSPASEDLTLLMNGAPGWEDAAVRLQATHVFWGVRERKNFSESTLAWKNKARLVEVSAQGAVYQLDGAENNSGVRSSK